MPITLIIRSGRDDESLGGDSAEATSGALTFDGARVVIGRGASCDVRLPDPSVSHRHASVRASGANHTLVDEGSTNGTFVGGVKLAKGAPRALRSGDLVRVGRVWLEVRLDQTPATRDLSLATRELALMLVSHAMRAQGDDVAPTVHVVEGPDSGALLALSEDGRAYNVGRDEACDLSLGDADASREHVQLVRRGGVVLVRDMGSKNGVLLGEVRVPRDRDMVWRGTAMIRLGATVLALEEPVAAALLALEEAEDEPMTPDDAPSLPPVAAKGPARAAADAESVPLAPPMGGLTPSAPIADVIARAAAEPSMRPGHRGAWSPTDMAVVALAVIVIALSVAGLFWLLRT